MKNKNEDTEQLSRKLISYLKKELKSSKIEYNSALTPLLGGNFTRMFRFGLSGVGDELSKHLVLRLFPRIQDNDFVIWESTLQNVLLDEEFPVARVHFVCIDKSILGGAFIIMEHLPGQMLWTVPPEIFSEALGKIHAELHRIDPEPLVNPTFRQMTKNSTKFGQKYGAKPY